VAAEQTASPPAADPTGTETGPGGGKGHTKH
jgi:hypothetical protein